MFYCFFLLIFVMSLWVFCSWKNLTTQNNRRVFHGTHHSSFTCILFFYTYFLLNLGKKARLEHYILLLPCLMLFHLITSFILHKMHLNNSRRFYSEAIQHIARTHNPEYTGFVLSLTSVNLWTISHLEISLPFVNKLIAIWFWDLSSYLLNNYETRKNY